ncbi:MAG: hypothetical protein M3463_19205 [Verrucomicrobiota bacterium]|nr:hypothetical protein [Verrucomicrobiota bacterium]
MKFSKDLIQKSILGGLLLMVVIYGYFSLLLEPLKREREVTRKKIAELQPQAEAASSQVKLTKSMELAAPSATTTLAQVRAMIPDGSPVAWFPTRVGDFFKREGFDKVATRMNAETVEVELPGFRRISWGIDLPKVNIVPFAAALAKLETEEPLLEVSSLQVNTSHDEPEHQRVLLTVNTLVRQ